MAEVTQELTDEIAPAIDNIDVSLGGIRSEMQNMRGTMVSMRQDIRKICGIVGRHDKRPDRIERRLALRELAEAQTRFEAHP